MNNWIKSYFNSFFSNKDAKVMRTKSFWNVILSLLMYLIILTAFYSATYRISFPYHLNHSTEYLNFVQTFIETSTGNVDFKIEKGESLNQIKAYKNGEELEVINTYYDSNYIDSKYNIIIDTRDPYLTFFEFNFIKDDTTISKEDYLNLEDKTGYTLNILDNQLISLDINEAKNALVDDSNYLNLENEKQSIDGYIIKYYLLNKYSDVFIAEQYLPNPYYAYYYKYYSTSSETNDFNYHNFLIINSVFMFTDFLTDKNIEMYYVGYFSGFEDNYQFLNSTEVSSSFINDRLKDLLQQSFDSSSTTAVLTRGYSLFVNMPYVLSLLLIASLFIFIFCKINKQNFATNYSQAFKLASSFVLFASIITALFSILTSYLYSTATVLFLGYGLTCLVIIVRCFIFIIIEYVRYKKNPLSDNEDIIIEKPVYNSTMDEKFGNNLDLAAAASKKKIIENKTNDDNEKMELE